MSTVKESDNKLSQTDPMSMDQEHENANRVTDDRNNKCEMLSTGASLVVEDKSYPIVTEHTTIGRRMQNKICFVDETVSKDHAQILAGFADGRIFVQDLNSTNKTKLNNVKLRPRMYYALKDGDELVFGKVKGIFKRTFQLVQEYPIVQNTPNSPTSQKQESSPCVGKIDSRLKLQKSKLSTSPIVVLQRLEYLENMLENRRNMKRTKNSNDSQQNTKRRRNGRSNLKT